MNSLLQFQRRPGFKRGDGDGDDEDGGDDGGEGDGDEGGDDGGGHVGAPVYDIFDEIS